jgi:hypothetical protein
LKYLLAFLFAFYHTVGMSKEIKAITKITINHICGVQLQKVLYFFDISWHIAICTAQSFCVTAKLLWMCQPLIHSSIFMWWTTIKLYISFTFSEDIHSVHTVKSNSRYCSICYGSKETQVTHYMRGKRDLLLSLPLHYISCHIMLLSCVLHCALNSQPAEQTARLLPNINRKFTQFCPSFVEI